uniref:FRAS1-related extracellular matrix protein N-terminal domain-containing protein n=1 Tax=Chrysemys picta bellii TaxID=8478 RepID=A0A8C3HKK9_CHRPI
MPKVAWGKIAAAKLVLVNKDFSVERGRVVYVTDNELRFNVPKERNPCKVEVVLNEPVTQRVGKLAPQIFDGHFLPNEVKYIHNGCPLLEEDRTIIETFVLHVEIRNPKSSITQFGKSSLDISEFLGISKHVDRSVLTFKYNANGLRMVCTVRITSSETSLPAFGQIVAEDPIGVEMYPKNVWIPVGIKGAIPNTQAQAAFISMFILESDQFILTPLTTAALDAEAGETPKDRLVFSITKCSLEGYITHLEDHTKAITSFTRQDLYDMKIVYQPPNITHSERQNYEGSVFMSSSPIMVHFSIRCAPRVAWNMGLDLLEVQSYPVTWDTLQIVGNDQLNAVQLVEEPPHGWITVRGGKGFKFTVKDHKDGVVRFQHGDSDATKDYAIFRIFDGRHKFPINILPKDDSAPFLMSNIVFQLPEGKTVLIEKHMLMSSDFDSSDDYILCKITKPPGAEEIIKTHFPDGPGIPVSTFLQRDVFHGLIYYHHLGGEIFQDSFDFILSDSQEPPNLSDIQTEMIHVMLVKDQLPEEVPGTTRQLVVKETEIAHITNNHLHFTDTKSPDNQLMYLVTKSYLTFSPSCRIYDVVKLIFTDSMKSYKKDPAISDIFQHAVTHLKVVCMPPERESGPDPLFEQFEFSVSDQQGRVVAGLNFNITVMPVDDEAPEIFTNHLTTEEGASFFISGENLMVSDLDTRDDLRIQLKKRPQYGHIELYGLIMQEGDMFTLEDLQSYKVRYQHDDSETLEDIVIFPATDGFNTADGVLRVQIIPVNDKPPELQAGLKSRLECLKGGHVVITTEYLYATDADSDDTKLTYMIARAPAHGVIQKRGFMVDKFFQLDVTQRLITYIHKGGEIGHSLCDDNLTLIVSDGEAGTVDSCCFNKALPPPLPLHTSLPICDLNITVLPINNQRPTIHLGMFTNRFTFQCIQSELPDYNFFHIIIQKVDFSPYSGDMCELGPGTLNAEDLDGPHNALSFCVIMTSVFCSKFSLSSSPPLRLPIGLMLVYMHDDTESLEDSFTMQLTDGKHTVQGTLYIYIMPVNDEIPHLSRLEDSPGVRTLTWDMRDLGLIPCSTIDFLCDLGQVILCQFASVKWA